MRYSWLGPLILSVALFGLIAAALAVSYSSQSSVPAMTLAAPSEVMIPHDLDQDGVTDLISYRVAAGKASLELSAGGERGWIFLRKEAPLMPDPKLSVLNNLIHLESRPEHRVFTYRQGRRGSSAQLVEIEWTRLMVPKARPKGDHLVVDKGSNHLYYFRDGRLIKTYRVATGRNQTGPFGRDSSFTPEGVFPVVVKTSDPQWFDAKNRKVIPGGVPENPLGSRWIGISVNGDRGMIYAIHGTNEPNSIGGYSSDGCIRLLNHEVEELFEQVRLGAVVEIVNRSVPQQVQEEKEHGGDPRGR